MAIMGLHTKEEGECVRETERQRERESIGYSSQWQGNFRETCKWQTESDYWAELQVVTQPWD